MSLLSRSVRVSAIASLLLSSGGVAIAVGSIGIPVVLGSLLAEGAIAQTQAATVLYVDPVQGSDAGAGTAQAPLKTITQALAIAPTSSVIQLAPGTYSAASGETFPLRLQPGVTLQGSAESQGQGIVIRGGGRFLSPTSAGQDIAILGANQAALIGVTVTNPNPRGYGLWIESSNPTVASNTFTGNTHDGISVVGRSAPLIRGNHFVANGANGITLYGLSQAQVQENLFERTGFGVNVGQKAAPTLLKNRIVGNEDGVVVQASSRPILRENVIEGNQRDGLVAIADSQPDLGTQAQPGSNTFRNNGRLDVNVKASSQIVPAFGNQLVSSRVEGRVDLAGTTQVTPVPAIAAAPAPIVAQAADKSSLSARSFPVPTSLQSSPPVAPPPQVPVAAGPAPRAIPIPVAAPETAARPVTTSGRSLPVPTVTPSVPVPAPVVPARTVPIQTAPAPTAAIEIPVTPPSRSVPVVERSPQPVQPAAVEIPVLPPENADPTPQPATVAARPRSGALLPVPSARIPVGNAGNRARNVAIGASTPGGPPPPPTQAQALGFQYRVVVATRSEADQARVRSLVPGAFRVFRGSQVFMQVGAYKTQAEADEMYQRVSSQGWQARIETTQ